MMKKSVNPSGAKNTLLSQGILYQSKYRLEISGQVGIHPDTSKLIDGSVDNQTRQTLINIRSILEEVNWGLENVVKLRIYLTKMSDYEEMNNVYREFFSTNPPARIAIAVKELPLNALIEIEGYAIGDQV